MRSFLSFLTISVFCALIGFNCFAAEKEDVTIKSDLVEILDTFDTSKKGHNPYSAPKLSDILEAKGTLVFFDNTNSTGKKPKIGGTIKTKPSNAMEKTLERARERFFGVKAEKKEPILAPVFSNRKLMSSNELLAGMPPPKQKIRFLELNYDGEKTIASIPPNTVIEVPFLKHIPYFFSRIEILNNGDIKVTETIERVVEPAEKDFKGIDRYFSKYYIDRTGKKHRTNLTVLEASVDNAPIPIKLIPDMKGIRVALHTDHTQMPGTHLYSVTYLFSNKITEFKNSLQEAESADFKELIWEVTGNHWDVPITRAGAVVIFPPKSQLYSQSAVTGGKRGYGYNYKIRKDKGNDLSFVLTFPLAPYEGLTILTNWAEKDTTPIFQNGKLDRFIIEHGTLTISCIAFLFVFSYYLATLFSLRKNQEKQKTQTSLLQKGDLTPAVLNYALKKEITPKSSFIVLLGMATKGFLSFSEDGNGTLLLVKETDQEKILTPLEKRVAKQLFVKDSTSFALTHANSLRLTRMMTDIEKTLIKEYRKKFTVFPKTYFWFGVLMAVISAFAISSMSLFPIFTALTLSAIVIAFLPVSFIGGIIYDEIRKKAWKDNKLKLIRLCLTILPLLVCLLGLFAYYGIQTTFWTAVFFFALLICIGIFKTLLRSPSVLGNSILENIEGYKLYLSSQDETLLNVMRNAESKIKALYGKHLPFAAALELDQLWTRRFVAFSEKENQLKPDWHKGKLPFTENFIAALFAEFSKAFPQKNTAKKSVSPSRFKKPNIKN